MAGRLDAAGSEVGRPELWEGSGEWVARGCEVKACILEGLRFKDTRFVGPINVAQILKICNSNDYLDGPISVA